MRPPRRKPRPSRVYRRSRLARPAPPSTDRDALRQHEKELETLRAEQRKARENQDVSIVRSNRSPTISANSNISWLKPPPGLGPWRSGSRTHDRLRAPRQPRAGLAGSLEQRRNLIAEVLAALQRIGRQAPPALIVRAEDVLASVRSAMMLGAVLPEMRHQAEVLSADLAELLRLRKQIGEERVSLERDLRFIADDSWRLTLLIEERQRRQHAKQRSSPKSASVPRKWRGRPRSQSITKLEQSLESAARTAAEAARLAEEQSRPPGSRTSPRSGIRGG